MKCLNDFQEGMLLGIAYGDALGSPCELQSCKHKIKEFTGDFHDQWIHERENQYKFIVRHSLGQVTDDTEMTISCLRALSQQYSRKTVLIQYHAFVNSATHCLGTNTKYLFHGYKRIDNYFKRFNERFDMVYKIESSQSNGHLMRASPFSLLEDTNIRTKVTCLDTLLTNPSTLAQEVGLFFVHLLHKLQYRHEYDIDKAKKTIIQMITDAIAQTDNTVFKTALQDSISTSFNRNVKENKGWNVHSLSLGLWVALNCSGFEDGIYFVISREGDTDTNASIAGSLLGCIYGKQNILSSEKTKRNWDIIWNCKPTISSGKLNNLKSEIRPQFYRVQELFTLGQKTLNVEQNIKTVEKDLTEQKSILSKRKRTSMGKIVFICGASTAGKTTLSRYLKKIISKKNYVVQIISQDKYRIGYYEIVDQKLSWEARSNTNWVKMCEETLASKNEADFVIVEGFSLFYAGTELINSVDFIFYLPHTIDSCIERRRYFPKQWDNVESYVEKCVWPAHLKHDTIIPFDKKNLYIIQQDTIECRANYVMGILDDKKNNMTK